jgi:hypothetical protein
MPNHGKESYAKVSSNTKEKKSILAQFEATRGVDE